MEVVDPRDFSSGGHFREEDFREAVKRFNWPQFQGKPVLIQGCGSVTLPAWVFMVITAELAPYAKSIHFGEVKAPIPVKGQLGTHG